MDEQGSLFDVPEKYRPPKVTPKSDQWKAYKGKPVSCDLCIINLHHGTPDTELSRASFALLQVSGKRWFLCSVHGRQIKDGERKL